MAGRIGKPCSCCGRFCGEGEAATVNPSPRRKRFSSIPTSAPDSKPEAAIAVVPRRIGLLGALLSGMAGFPFLKGRTSR